MNLQETNTPANIGDAHVCRKCGKTAEWVHTDTLGSGGDERTASYCELTSVDVYWSPVLDVWFDIFQCTDRECSAYTADLTRLMYFSDNDATFYMWKDEDKIEIAPGQQALF